MNDNNNRPVFLNLLRIDLPVTAVISIGHRISGLAMFLSIPFFLYLFDLSLSSAEGFAKATAWLDNFAVKLICILMLWGLIHHFLAGIRFLLIDMQIGMGKAAANRGAWLVHVAELVVLFVAVAVLL